MKYKVTANLPDLSQHYECICPSLIDASKLQKVLTEQGWVNIKATRHDELKEMEQLNVRILESIDALNQIAEDFETCQLETEFDLRVDGETDERYN